MATANPAYQIPGVSGSVSTVDQTPVASGARLPALLGTAGSGPDVPTVYTNLAAALAAYGSPGAPGTLPWGLMAAFPTIPGYATAPVIVQRVGVTRAALALQDAGTAASLALLDASSAVVATIKSAGVTYGGAAGSGLTVTVTAGTSSGFKVVIKAGSTPLSTYDNMANGAALVAAVTAAADSNVTAVVGTSALVAANISATALTGGGSSKGTVATLQGVGQYAGSAGNNLAVTVAASTAYPSAAKVTITNTATSTVLAIYDNITSGSALFGASEGDITIAAQIGASTNVPATLSITNLAGGADGLTAAPGQSPDPVAASLSLLFSGLVAAPRYLCALWDASAVETDVQAALTAAITPSSSVATPMPCIAYLGSALGGTITTITTLASSLTSPTIQLWGLPGGRRRDPALNADRSFDGFYVAATKMALKAALPVQHSLIGQTLPGWSGNSPITVGGITRPPTLADVSALGAVGASYGLSGPGYAGLQIVDSVTTAPQTGANAYQAQPGMQDGLHHAQQAAYSIGNTFKGNAASAGVDYSNQISASLHAGLSQLAGEGSISSVDGVSTSLDPTTLGRYIPQVAVGLSPTVRNIAINFSINAGQ